MDENDFFRLYIPALELALANDKKNLGYHVHGPDWYIENEELRNQVDLFEQINFDQFCILFQTVASYFDAKSHYFDYVGMTHIEEYKLQLIKIISQLKSQYGIT